MGQRIISMSVVARIQNDGEAGVREVTMPINNVKPNMLARLLEAARPPSPVAQPDAAAIDGDAVTLRS